jgi:hypothetical protein
MATFPSISGLIHHVETYEHPDGIANPPFLQKWDPPNQTYPSDNDDVRKWKDQTGNQPKFDKSGNPYYDDTAHGAGVDDGKGAVELDGTDYLVCGLGNPEYAVTYTIFCVFKQTNPTDGETMVEINAASGDDWNIFQAGGNLRAGTTANYHTLMATPDTNWHMVTAKITGDATAETRMDGFLNNTGTMGATAGSASVTLGSSAGGINHMECDITAWIVYDRALSKSEIYEMEVYLNDQYSLGFSILSPMLPSPPIPDFPTLDIGFDAILGYWDVDPQTSVRDAADDMCEHGDTVTTWYDLAQKTPPFSGYPNLTGSATYRRPEPNGKGYIRFADTETLAYNSFPFGGWYGDNHTWIVVGRLHTAGSGTNILAELSHNGANAEQLTENVTGGSFEYGVAGSTDLVGPLDLDWHIWTFRTRAGTALSRAKYDGAQGSNNMPWNNGAVAGATTTSIQLGDSAAGAGALWDVCAVILVNGEVEWEDEMRLEHYFNNKFQLGRSCISDPDRPLSTMVMSAATTTSSCVPGHRTGPAAQYRPIRTMAAILWASA